MIWRYGSLTFLLAAASVAGFVHAASPGQSPAPPPTASAQPDSSLRDPALEAVSALIGRATFLRNGYAGTDLVYDAAGHIKGEPRQFDWTLAGANIEKVTRKSGGIGAGELELDGIRVAMRYNPDQHIFERHPQKDEKLKIMLTVNDAARGLQGALATIFAVGIDPGLQRAMPAFWRHYFSPAMPWPADDLTGQTIIASNVPAGNGLEIPVLEKKLEPDFTHEASQDHVKGVIQMRMTIGIDGVPRRITVKQPLGYGLDAKVAETAARYRFHPGLKNGNPIAVEMLLNQSFDSYPPPPR